MVSLILFINKANMINAEDQSSEASETMRHHDEAKEWCILYSELKMCV